MIEIPEVYSLWRHKNGNLYRVLIVSNLDATEEKSKEYPITITYRSLSDRKVWSRTIDRWHGSMTAVKTENVGDYK